MVSLSQVGWKIFFLEIRPPLPTKVVHELQYFKCNKEYIHLPFMLQKTNWVIVPAINTIARRYLFRKISLPAKEIKCIHIYVFRNQCKLFWVTLYVNGLRPFFWIIVKEWRMDTTNIGTYLMECSWIWNT